MQLKRAAIAYPEGSSGKVIIFEGPPPDAEQILVQGLAIRRVLSLAQYLQAYGRQPMAFSATTQALVAARMVYSLTTRGST